MIGTDYKRGISFDHEMPVGYAPVDGSDGACLVLCSDHATHERVPRVIAFFARCGASHRDIGEALTNTAGNH